MLLPGFKQAIYGELKMEKIVQFLKFNFQNIME